jgi:hypothetical protein
MVGLNRGGDGGWHLAFEVFGDKPDLMGIEDARSAGE